ncbi:helix-turn-helix domain-containing protein [Streptomyces gibsoniae]|uniref:Helix-turn-helix transcriptional regulator n=1 Tax=Streptomyces gibsoniae TaxID=3075529 RepID=A0ABU2TVX7_9ACTN|nr:helix-turn-helix transcriptional regulator [Streptomyces sp. DSM 41699]MDT0465126.1 helix-turn-helix transcriptional regulator [Streptomyces sp. DSM 41699]
MTTIGDRVRSLREFRDLTQEQLAERAGVHVDTIRKLEQGVRQSARINTLRALARALDAQLERLVGQPTVTQQLTDDGGLLALRDAIQDIGVIPGVLADLDLEDPPDEQAWTDSVRDATALYWQGDYSRLSGTLPLLLRDGRAVAREAPTERVWSQLALAYQLAACLATQAGHPDWAYTAVEKQLAAAARASDPLMEGMGVSTLSWVLLRQGRWEQAQDIAERKADALEPSFRKSTPNQLAVYGNLLVAAATPAARRDRHDDAVQMLITAEAAAIRSGPVRAYGTAFSLVDVRTQKVNIALAGSDGRPDEALRFSGDVNLDEISRPVHSAAYRVDVAQAQYQTGDSDGALATLLEVETEQPEWIRFQALATSTVREMLDTERRRNTPLRSLAARLGVDPAA